MNKIKKLSVVIPVYNEENTIDKIIKKVLKVDLGNIKKEVIVVNDGSTDDTLKKLKKLEKKYPVKIISYSRNKGKTWALRQGFKKITGEVVVVQDGDLEYDPNDFRIMLKKMSHEKVKVVYGSRNLGNRGLKYSGLSFYIGGWMLTWLTNLLYGTRITDEPTCYKMFETKLLKSIKLKSKRFEFCPEVTAKVAKKGVKIYEVPISYDPRHIDQGKKIKARDFLEAVGVLINGKYR